MHYTIIIVIFLIDVSIKMLLYNMIQYLDNIIFVKTFVS